MVLKIYYAFLHYEASEALEQVALRGWGCPTLGSVQSQVGQVFEQLSLVESVPVHGKGNCN